MKLPLLLLALLLSFCAQAQLPKTFVAAGQGPAPDYSKPECWSALPFRKDAGDYLPKGENPINDSLKAVDVFYIYPTIYRKGDTWTADLGNKKLNKKIDRLPVKFQTSPFGQIARIYAPRYRQAHLDSFRDSTGTGEQALDFAYQDVKAAFEYYLQHYNQGRPIVIVSHSQGTRHSRLLLKDYFDNDSMRQRLVCAYVVGFGIFPEQYGLLKPCAQPNDVNCYVTWASFGDGHVPEPGVLLGNYCLNPVSWTVDTTWQSGKGGILVNLNRKMPFHNQARVKDNYLWVRTNTTFFKKTKVLHLLDFNLFWYDIRDNAALRVKTYLSSQH
ncbi:MAG: DUF3089 domain-containing protein [Chitinophagales bacterium]|nr:DUF3089 domain-containing protein [Chitinophagales bacterium]